MSGHIFVIVHGARKHVLADGTSGPVYLGAFGWTPHVNQALQCASDFDAKQWLRDAQRNTPMIFVGSKPEALRIEKPSGEPGSVQSEYDPFGGLNA
jgi:hypothetical protein